jgi:nucleoside-diphosphate-sugar epimerase
MTLHEDKPTAAITGANGYVGSIASDALAKAGFQIRRLVRQPVPGSTDHAYDLRNGCSPDGLRDADVLVHCAYDFAPTSRGEIWEANVFGTRSLLDLAVSSGVRRTIFISSMSAYAGTRQIYGRAKLASEADAFARNMCVVRPGLIYGPGWGGMAGALRKLVSLPIVPLIGGQAHQFTLHEDDLRTSFVTLAESEVLPTRPLGLAHPEPIQFEDLLRAIARVGGDRRPQFFPLPWLPIYWAMRGVERTSFQLPLRADSILGLVRPAPIVSIPSDVKELGIEFRAFGL